MYTTLPMNRCLWSKLAKPRLPLYPRILGYVGGKAVRQKTDATSIALAQVYEFNRLRPSRVTFAPPLGANDSYYSLIESPTESDRIGLPVANRRIAD